MARFEDLPVSMVAMLKALPCPAFDTQPWISGPPLSERRVAMISTAGLHRRDDPPFTLDASDYRVIPTAAAADDLVMSHVSVNFDRSGFRQDLNVIFPIDRLKELAEARVIGSVADHHYSFMGATEPEAMAPIARRLAGMLKKDRVDAVLLVPV